MGLSQTLGKNSVRMHAGSMQKVAANTRKLTTRSAEVYPAKMLDGIATAIHSRHYPLQCNADVYTYCNTRSRWQICLPTVQCGVQGHHLGQLPLASRLSPLAICSVRGGEA